MTWKKNFLMNRESHLKMCVIQTTALNSNGKWIGKHATIDNITSQKSRPYVLHPVIVKISPLLWCPLLMFCYILLMGPFLMIVNNQSVHQSSKKRMEEYDPTLRINCFVDTSYIPNSICLKSMKKATTPLMSIRKCYRDQIIVTQKELPLRGIQRWKISVQLPSQQDSEVRNHYHMTRNASNQWKSNT